MVTQKLECVNKELILLRMNTLLSEGQAEMDSNLSTEFTGNASLPVVVTPEDEEQVADILRVAGEERWTVAPFGSGTQFQIGQPLEEVDIVLKSERLNRISDYAPEDMVISVQSGVSIEKLQETLRENAQMLPIDPAVSPKATIGGLVATAATGPMQTHYGTLRDMTIGTHVVYPDGTMIRTGGKVVKNVAGYDMTKLFVGSLGTLGFLTELSFKLRPIPLARSLVVVSGTSAKCKSFLSTMIQTHLIPSRAEVLFGEFPMVSNTDAKWHVAVDCDENRLSGEFQKRSLVSLAADFSMETVCYEDEDDERFWALYQAHLRDVPFVIRFTAEPKKIVELADVMQSKLENLGVRATVSMSAIRGTGRFYMEEANAATQEAVTRTIRQTLSQHQGYAVVESGLPEFRQRVNCFDFRDDEARMMKAIKDSIDPNHLMNPGRLFRGLNDGKK